MKQIPKTTCIKVTQRHLSDSLSHWPGVGVYDSLESASDRFFTGTGRCVAPGTVVCETETVWVTADSTFASDAIHWPFTQSMVAVVVMSSKR